MQSAITNDDVSPVTQKAPYHPYDFAPLTLHDHVHLFKDERETSRDYLDRARSSKRIIDTFT